MFTLGCIAFTARISTAQIAEQQEEQTVAPDPNDPNLIQGEILPAPEGSPPAPQTTPEQGAAPGQAETQAIAAPSPAVATFNNTVLHSTFDLQLVEDGIPDGDTVTVKLNGRTVTSVVLTARRRDVPLELKPGANKIEVIAVDEGSRPPNTVRVVYPSDETLDGQELSRPLRLATGGKFETLVGLPQIAICSTVVKFPCFGGNPYPESAQHALEALGVPPQPISAPLETPTSTPNPLRSSYPRFLTIDRGPNGAKRIARQRASTKNYKCPDSRTQDRDEYPQALFLENASSAHIKCITLGDNRGSGATIGNQVIL